MPLSTTDVASYGSSQITSYYNIAQQTNALQEASLSQLTAKNTELTQKQNIQIQQLKEIQDKEKLLLTRSRMLQISQDRNSYKKKIIYTLIALIFGVLILTLVIYILYIRKIKGVPS